MEFTELLMIFSAVALVLLYGWVLLWSCCLGAICITGHDKEAK